MEHIKNTTGPNMVATEGYPHLTPNEDHQDRMVNLAEDLLEQRRRRDREYKRLTYPRDRKKILARRAELKAANIELFRQKDREMYRKRRERLGFTVRKVRPKGTRTPEIARQESYAACARWRDRNREKLREKWRLNARNKKLRLAENPPSLQAELKHKATYDHAYRKNNHNKRKAWSDAFIARSWNDPQFHLGRRIRTRIRVAIKKQYGAKKCAKSIELLGCSIAEARRIIESKFVDGMNWEVFNQGKIHLDHIVPLAKFDLTDPNQQRRAFHISNLQPLWALDNLKKGDKILVDNGASMGHYWGDASSACQA